jgi:outer membrane immunogenic protein
MADIHSRRHFLMTFFDRVTHVKVKALVASLLMGTVGWASASNAGQGGAQGPTNWSSAYVGGSLGRADADSSFVDSEYNGLAPFPTVAWGVPSRGAFVGLHGGRNWQHDHRVYGVEGEWGRLKLKGSSIQPGVDPFGDPYDGVGIVKKGWYGGLSGRFGYARDRTLFYGKAGVVYSNAKLAFADTCTTAPCGPGLADASKKLGWGYQIGAGVEHALSQRWTVKAEYAYLDFGRRTIAGEVMAGGAGTPYRIHADMAVHTIKLGVSYRF